MYEEKEPIEVKVGDLRPRMRSVNVDFKVVNIGDVREVTSRSDANTHKVTDATVADETGSVFLTLWDDKIEEVEVDKSYRLENGYTNLFKGHLRLNIGRYGAIESTDKEFEELNTENNVSDVEHEQQERRSFRSSYGGGYQSRSPRSSGGYRGGPSSGRRGKPRRY